MKRDKQKNKEKGGEKNISATSQISITDPLGMYTGVPADPSDTPVQDADDL